MYRRYNSNQLFPVTEINARALSDARTKTSTNNPYPATSESPSRDAVRGYEIKEVGCLVNDVQ